MNPKQKKVLLIGSVAVAVIILFPPWDYFDSDTSARSPAGYHFFLTPPRQVRKRSLRSTTICPYGACSCERLPTNASVVCWDSHFSWPGSALAKETFIY